MFLIVLAAVGFAAGPSGAADVIAGGARAFRGDVLIVRGAKVRLFGVVAPERREMCDGPGGAWPCGKEAKAALNALVAGRDVVCTVVAKVGHGSVQAECVTEGMDIADALVRAGWARAETRMTDAYVAAENEARAAGLGLWHDVAH